MFSGLCSVDSRRHRIRRDVRQSGSPWFQDLARPSSRGHAQQRPASNSERGLWAPWFPAVCKSDGHGMPSVGARSVIWMQCTKISLTLLLLN